MLGIGWLGSPVPERLLHYTESHNNLMGLIITIITTTDLEHYKPDFQLWDLISTSSSSGWENKLISFFTELIFSFNVILNWQSSRRWIQVWLYRASWSCQIYQRSQKKLDRIYTREYFALTGSKYFMMTLMCLYFLKSGDEGLLS